MRVIAGEARGRRLVAPPGYDVRPTSDRVREATFNALWSMGAIEGATVLDLFAGTGALGIEAISRGARHVTFVERDRAARAAIEENLERCGFADRATVIPGDALTLVRSIEPVDLALLDPPYDFDSWEELLPQVRATIVVIEAGREVPLPAGWTSRRKKRYRTTVVEVAQTSLQPGAPR
jgi:16S rRNA (guanine966-N2)-methyltransferase